MKMTEKKQKPPYSGERWRGRADELVFFDAHLSEEEKKRLQAEGEKIIKHMKEKAKKSGKTSD